MINPSFHFTRRILVVATVAAFALPTITNLAFAQARSKPSQANIPSMDFPHAQYCVELNDRGIEESKVDKALIRIAIHDSSVAEKRRISFYKVIPSSNKSAWLYVFMDDKYSDRYMIYATDEGRKKFVRKYRYASLHYKCDKPSL